MAQPASKQKNGKNNKISICEKLKKKIKLEILEPCELRSKWRLGTRSIRAIMHSELLCVIFFAVAGEQQWAKVRKATNTSDV